jgi:glycosyltransferase involved in cell wall biosynthesis
MMAATVLQGPAGPRLTIGMPVFNGARFIRPALDSLLAQTFTDFEILVADNASTDATPDICREYAARDSRVRYVRHDRNLGLFPNTEFLMREARGAYFMLVGDDDVYESGYAACLVSALETRPEVGLSYSDFAYVREDGTPVAGGTTVFLEASSSRVRNMALFLLKRPVLPMIMGVFRTGVVRGALPFVSFGPMLGGVDLVFMARALASTRVHSTREVLFHYRLKDRSSSFPADWPRTALGRGWYIFKLNARVSAGMCRAIIHSDINPIARSVLVVLALASLAAHAVVLPAIEATRVSARRAASQS